MRPIKSFLALAAFVMFAATGSVAGQSREIDLGALVGKTRVFVEAASPETRANIERALRVDPHLSVVDTEAAAEFVISASSDFDFKSERSLALDRDMPRLVEANERRPIEEVYKLRSIGKMITKLEAFYIDDARARIPVWSKQASSKISDTPTYPYTTINAGRLDNVPEPPRYFRPEPKLTELVNKFLRDVAKARS